MGLLDEIQEKFSSGADTGNWRYINCLKNSGYIAYVVKDSFGYGVAIPIELKDELNENFSSCNLLIGDFFINNKTEHLLCLTCYRKEIRNEFAAVCANFVDPGENGTNRIELQKNPLTWWKKWCELMGNSFKNKKAYSILAELFAYHALISNGKKVNWTGPMGGTNDLETENEYFEVKSTLKHHANKITISSEFQLNQQNQLDDPKKLYLFFCKLEPSDGGISINEMVKTLIKDGVEESDLEYKLERVGCKKGRSIRKEKYRVLEKRCYEVNDNFPRITDNSFVGGKKPTGISHITYDLDLDSIKDYTTW